VLPRLGETLLIAVPDSRLVTVCPIQDLQIVGNYFGGRAFFAVFLPLLGSQTAFDVDFAAFPQ
jgi:hypothetical protein